MQIGLGRFSSYVVDVDALMGEVNSQVTGRFTKTARWPCTIRLNPLDLDAILKQYGLPPATPDGPARMFNVPVIRDQGQRLGEITVTQCQTSLYQPGECDCAQAAENVNAT